VIRVQVWKDLTLYIERSVSVKLSAHEKSGAGYVFPKVVFGGGDNLTEIIISEKGSGPLSPPKRPSCPQTQTSQGNSCMQGLTQGSWFSPPRS